MKENNSILYRNIFGSPLENTKNYPGFSMQVGMYIVVASYRACYQYKAPSVVFRLTN